MARGAREDGYEHVTPMTDEAVAVLNEARETNPGSGEKLILPASKDLSASISRGRTGAWWRKAERLAGVEPKARRGWHSLRRKFASDLMGTAAQGALRVGRLEGGADGAAPLSVGRRGTA